MKLSGIVTALKNGCVLHAFRSGGGLRVVRIEKEKRGGDLVGYGEHPMAADAFSHANEDYLAGGRKYEKVYGKIHPHYLTGAVPSGNDPLDAWIYKGFELDAYYENKKIVVELTGYNTRMQKIKKVGTHYNNIRKAIRVAFSAGAKVIE